MTGLRLVNLTPHAISVRDVVGAELFSIAPSGAVARVSTTVEVVGAVYGVASIVRTVYGDVEGIPAPVAGTFYVTSSLVAQAAHREDVIAPNTGPTAVRENGQVVGVRGFQVF
ncbi:hypothetical protein ACJU26_08745 [Acidithiobacillus sp. M4-SHS-6]|uniref:hypothetical protein n=1 Tax=Acidithiobacillus sp. M4-SHS-6 TaxID=3383024 RepID=UPI0039BE1161